MILPNEALHRIAYSPGEFGVSCTGLSVIE